MDVFLPTHNIHFIIIEYDANLNPKIGNLFSEWQERDQKQFIYTLYTSAYSIASGLDYPGLGPEQAFLKEVGRVKFEGIDDKETITSFYELSQLEGIIPALESAHAVALATKMAPKLPGKTILVNLSGRGDKDIDYILKNYNRLNK